MGGISEKLKTLRTHWRNCAELRALLARYDSPNLRNLYWYDLQILQATSLLGFLRVTFFYLLDLRKDDVADSYGASTIYWAPQHGNGLDEPAPTVWHCRNIETKPYHDPDEWCNLLEAGVKGVCEDYELVKNHSMKNPASVIDVDAGQWKNVFITDTQGAVNLTLPTDCRHTLDLIDDFPLCTNFGFVFFSITLPGTHIKSHSGGSNLRLRYHLPIDVIEPDQNMIRVAHEKRHWYEGQVLVFDDSYNHEVWNTGTQLRSLLIVDLWHPSLSESDIKCLSHPLFNRFGKVNQ